MKNHLFISAIKHAGAVISLSLFISCLHEIDTVSSGHVAIYEGSYSQGIEDSIFEPCDINEIWMITFSSEDVASRFTRRMFEVVESSNPMYVNLRGVPSKKGSFRGTFTIFARKFEVSEILDVQGLTLGDCQIKSLA